MVPNLLHLVRLGIRPVALQIDLLFDSRSGEHVMTPTSAFLKAKGQQKQPQIVEANVRISSATENAIQNLLVFAHATWKQ